MDTKIYPNLIIYDILLKYINDTNITYNLYEDISIIDVNNLTNFITNLENSNNQLINSNVTNTLEIIQNYYNNNFFSKESENFNIEKSENNELENNEFENNELENEILVLDKFNSNNNANSITIDDDPWESSINDDKFYINNKVARIFPVLKNFNNFSKIKIDDESFCYITIREIADIISKILCYHLLEHNLNPQKTKIVDYTSGVGGNILSFCKYFKYVYAVELSETRAEFLQNNINIYGFKNVKIINKCAIEFNSNDLIEVNPSVIFIDPPWGGINYKNSDNLLLNLGDVPIENLLIDICSKFSIHYKKIIEEKPKEKNNNFNNKFIVIKLPKNYDIDYFYNYIKSNNNFENYNISCFLYILNKMIIIVCELQFKYF